MKRFLACLLTLALAISLIPANVFAAEFRDVSSDAYFYGAVQWALKENITAGTSDTTFSPNKGCTRGQVVSFLWRTAKRPASVGTLGFSDVPANAYYAEPVKWAVENGITYGTSETEFEPEGICTRAQIVTFLWRFMGYPAPAKAGSFTDVSAGEYYADAVAWAVENGITHGISETEFAPEKTCTRAQVVTFLYRTEQANTEFEPTEPPMGAPTGDIETISKTVLMDEAGIKITAICLDFSDPMGVGLKLLIENNSGEDLTFQCRNSSVNGYMVDTIMSTEVLNGKKAYDEMLFLTHDLERCHIDTIADIAFSFHIFDTDDWDVKLNTEIISLKTSAAESYVYKFDDSGVVAYNQDGIKIVIQDLVQSDFFSDSQIQVYIENNTDKNLTFQVRDVSVNGFMMDCIFSSDVSAHKHAADEIIFWFSDLEESGISDIVNAQFSFHIFSQENWDTLVETPLVSIDFY